MDKAKKRKILIAIICSVVLVVGAIVSIILLTRDKFEIYADTKIEYNEHDNMRVVTIPTGYSILNNSSPDYYSNATVKIKDSTTTNLGIYSFIENRIIIPTEYTSSSITAIPLISNGKISNEHIFKTTNKTGTSSKRLVYFDDEGNQLNVTNYDESSDTLFGYIKQKYLNLSEKRSGIKVKTKSKFSTEKIVITNATYLESFETDDDDFELWQITAEDGSKYINLYEVDDEERELVQTINNTLGQDISIAENVSVYFLKDGTPRIIYSNLVESDEHSSLEYQFYNTKFKDKGDGKIIINENLATTFEVGNSVYYQYIYPSTEDDYDFFISVDGETNYFTFETYKLNLKNGKFKSVKFKYIVTGGELNSSPENISPIRKNTILLKARKIDDGRMLDESNILINDDLDIKTIDYDINTITEITDDRYLVDSNNGQYIIDEDYEKICYLGDFDNLFTTEESVILTDDTHTYICTLDGVVVKKYLKNEVKNAYDKKYYIVETKVEKDGVTYTEKYLERLGYRGSQLISVKADNNSHTYNDKTYVEYSDAILNKGIGITTRVRANNKKFSYDFYNLHGKLLLTLDNFETQNRVLTYWGYTDDDHAIVHISTNVAGVEYYIVLDR